MWTVDLDCGCQQNDDSFVCSFASWLARASERASVGPSSSSFALPVNLPESLTVSQTVCFCESLDLRWPACAAWRPGLKKLFSTPCLPSWQCRKSRPLSFEISVSGCFFDRWQVGDGWIPSGPLTSHRIATERPTGSTSKSLMASARKRPSRPSTRSRLGESFIIFSFFSLDQWWFDVHLFTEFSRFLPDEETRLERE